MRWTRITPTQPGFYWVRYSDNATEVVELKHFRGCLMVTTVGYEYNQFIHDFKKEYNNEWAGPIPLPEN